VTPNWIDLQGSVNARDVGGLPLAGGGVVRPGVLIRTAHLQDLSANDVRHLVDDLGVQRVVDLRSDIEVDRTGPGPLHDVASVTIHHLSLYPDVLDRQTEVRESSDENPVMPWHREFASDRGPVVQAYLRYLVRRPDSIVAALRAIAEPDGATVVHCAAGKDRTGVIVALALSLAGVPRDVIAADYQATETQLEAIIKHLSGTDLYIREVTSPQDIPVPSADIMHEVLDAIDEDHGSLESYLGQHGWTPEETAALRSRLAS